MRKKGENRLVLLRIFVIVFIIVFLLILLFFPMFIEGKFNLFQLLGERLFAGGGKEILLSVPGPCVDLDNLATYGTKVSRTGTSPEYDFSIVENILLCSKTYSFGDQAGANGVLIINADNIELDCNGAVISNPTPASADKAISVTTKNNIKINSCNTTGFGYGVYAEGMTNSLINNSLFFTYDNIAVYLTLGSSNNYLNKINITTKPLSLSATDGIKMDTNSKNNTINNSFIYNTNLHAIYTKENYTKIYQTTIVNSSVNGNNPQGAVRIEDAVGTIIDNVNITKTIRGIVFISSASKHCENNSISNVFIKDSREYGIQNRRGCSDLIITDGTIENSTQIGISIEENNVSIFRTFVNGTTSPNTIHGGIVVRNAFNFQGTKQLRNISIENVSVMNNSFAGINIIASNVTIVGTVSINNGRNINFEDSGNSLVIDSVFMDSTNANSDVNLSALGGLANANRTNITFINSTFSGFGISAKNRIQLSVNWWLEVLTQHSSGAPLEGANIKAIDRNGFERLSDITGPNGRMDKKNLTEFIYATNSLSVFNNYNVSANSPGYGSLWRFVNVSTNRFEVFSFDIDTILPLISYTSKTALDGAVVNRDWIFVDIDITEDNIKNVSFNLYNSSRNLAAFAASIYHYGFDLDKYNLTTNNLDLTTKGLSSSIVDISGAAYNPVTNSLFLINNNPVAGAPFNNRNVMSEIDMNYNFIRNIYLTRSDIIDSEGIAYIGTDSATGKHKFAVIEESKNTGKHAFLYIFEIDGSTTQIDLSTQATEYDLGNMASDDGMEGVSYAGKDSAGNLIFYVVRQTPKEVRKVVVVPGTTTVVSNTQLFDSATYLSDVGWLRDLYYDNNTNSLFVLGVGASDTAPRKVINVRLDGTRIFDISGIDVGGPIKPEGIAFDKFGDYMYVVGEPHHLSAFKTANFHSKNNFTNLSAGIYYYNVTIEDLGGNKAATSTRSITLVGISSCTELNIAGANYTLLQNISSSGTCFNITANDIGLNGNGYTVTYGTSGTEWSLGIAVLGANGTFIQNISVIEGTHLGSTKPAIHFSSSFNGSLRDAIIKTNGTNSSGINIAESSGVVIASSYINTSGGGSKGIYVYPLDKFISIENTTIFTYGSEAYGMKLHRGSSGRAINNTISTYGFASRGFWIDFYPNISLIGNTVFTSGALAYGMEIQSIANGIFIANNNITALNANSLFLHNQVSGGHVYNNTFFNSIVVVDAISGFRFANSSIFNQGGNGITFANGTVTSNNTFLGISFNIEGASGNGISLESSSHSFSFYDSVFNVSSSGGSNLFISSAVSSGEWNFTNVSRSAGGPFTKNWETGAIGTLNVHWYVNAYANDSASFPLTNVNISAVDRYYQPPPPEYPVSFSTLTGANGRIARQAILDYNQTSPTVITVHSNYTFTAIASSGETLAQSWNITEMNNTNLVFNFDTIFPLIFFVNPTPPSGAATLNSSVEINASIIEKNLREVKFNWNEVNYTAYNDSLVLMMNMDNRPELGESSTLIKDLSKYGGDGIVTGAVVNTSGRYGGAFTFDGINDYIDLGTPAILNTNVDDITISAWVKLEADLCHKDTNYEIFTNDLYQNYGYIFRIQDFTSQTGSCGKILFRTSRTGLDSFVNTLALTYPNDNEWHHVVAAKSGSDAFIYLDGVQVGFNIGGMLSPVDSPISSKISGVDQPMNGSIDEVRIWNRGLSTNEIKEQYYSNLQKYNSTNWVLYVNQSDLTTGNYTYFASAKDKAGNENITDIRSITFSPIFPLISFVEPTLPDGAATLNSSIEINASIIEENLGEVKFNWNEVNYTVYNDSLVLMMNMDNRGSLGESAALIKDLSRYGNDGTVIGAVWGSSGKFGGTYSFDGVGDYIDLGSNIGLSVSGGTIGAWFKSTNSFNAQYIVSHRRDGFDNNDRIYLRIGTGVQDDDFECGFADAISFTTEDNDVAGDNRWHYGLITWDSTTSYCYLDGRFIGSYTATLPYADETVYIGDLVTSISDTFKWIGDIDEVRIWSRVLSANEIKEQYYSNLYKYNQTQWYLYVNQSDLIDGSYTYFASAKDRAGNENITEVRSVTVFIPPRIIDISDLGFQNIQPGSFKNIPFSVNVLSYGGQANILSLNVNFTRGGVVRGESVCSFAGSISSSLFNYSCSAGIWYFDEAGVWDVGASLLDIGGRWSSYVENFILMSDKYLSNDPSISFGSVNPGAQNIESSLEIRNVGNDLISEIKLLGNDLTGESDNTKKIFLVDFAAKSAVGSCTTGFAIGYIETTIPGFNLPRGDNSFGFGIADLYLCLKQAPFGTSQVYSAKGTDRWQITFPFES